MEDEEEQMVEESYQIYLLKKAEKEKRKTMTLDEAIQHCEEKALCGDACGLEHKQLAEWLKELKRYRMDEETKLDKTTVTKVLERMLNTPKFDLEKFRKANDIGDFSAEYSGIDNGQRFSGKKFFDTEKEAEDEMDRLMDDEKNDTISIHMGNHIIRSFAKGYIQ